MRKKVKIEKRTLEELYTKKRLTAGEIAKILNVGTSTVSRYRKKYNIQTIDRYDSLLGKQFGRLIVVQEVRQKGGKRGDSPIKCICKCSCGKTTIVIKGNLPKTSSCGCLRIEKMRKEYGESISNSILYDYKNTARKRCLVWRLSKEKALDLFKLDCYYCGKKPYTTRTMPSSRLYGSFTYNGIDRKDNDKGYTIENSVTCCQICNYMKWSLSYKNFINHVHKIKQTQSLKIGQTIEGKIRKLYKYTHYKASAKVKNLSFEIEENYFNLLIGSECYYCSQYPSLGVDRLDNNVGYVKKNCVPCCKICNFMKSNYTLKVFLGHASKIKQNHPQLNI